MTTVMKMKFWMGLCMLGIATLSFGQKGAAARMSAEMSVGEYTLTPQSKDRLEYAKKQIDLACEDAKMADEPKTWRLKGQIYGLLALDDQLSTKNNNASADAYDAYVKALSMEESRAEVKGKTKDKIAAKQEFIDGFTQTARALYRQASLAFNDQDWTRSFTQFSKLAEMPVRTATFDTKKKIAMTFEAGKEEIDMLTNGSFLGGMAAVNAGKLDEAEKILMPLARDKKLKEEDIKRTYRILSGAFLQAGKADKAKAIVAEGRKLYPTDFDLLISEINIALQEGRLAELENELNQAVKADPNNVELHFVMGNMYDELFRGKINFEKGKVTEEAHKEGKAYFDKAVEWYKKGIKLQPTHFNSLYSLGAIHVNYSNYFATIIQQSEKMKDPERKALEAEYDKYVDLGLVHLLDAEKVDANDLGLIRALKEVYTRKSDDVNWKKYDTKEKELMKKGGQ